MKVVSFTSLPPHRRSRDPNTHGTGELVGPKAIWTFAEEKNSLPLPGIEKKKKRVLGLTVKYKETWCCVVIFAIQSSLLGKRASGCG
jgi:hypothetical protein